MEKSSSKISDHGNTHATTEDKVDVLRQRRWRSEEGNGESKNGFDIVSGHRFASYEDFVLNDSRDKHSAFESTQYDGEVFDDDVLEKEDDETVFSIAMTREEKIEARRPSLNCLIVKLVGRPIGYHYLWWRILVLWRTQDDPLVIDLG